MFESISQAIHSIFAHKTRSLLTMLGIIIGIASIITIISGIKGTNEQIKENLIGAGNNVVTVQLYQNDMAYDMMYSANPAGVAVLDAAQREDLCALGGVEDVSFYRSRSYADSVYYQNQAFNGSVYGVDSSYFSVNDYCVKLGRGFSLRDFDTRQKVVILDETAARTLFGGDDPVGKTLEILQEPFTVVGVVVRSSTFEPVIESVQDYHLYVQTGNGCIYLPESVWPIVYRFDEPQNVAVRAASTDDMTRAGKAVADYLCANQIQEQAARNGFAYRNDDLLKQAEQLQEMSSSTNTQLIWIAGISLLVGGIGVMNIMLVSVTERTNEIGLKKAIGAKRRRILSQFLTEAAVLTGFGGILGVLLGIGLSQLLSHFMHTPTAISVPAILISAAFSILIGLIFGLVPAIKASKLKPIEALRRD